MKSKTPEAANKWIDLYVKEGREMSKQHPPGSSWIEKLDWKAYGIIFRLHVLDHLNQAKKVLRAVRGA